MQARLYMTQWLETIWTTRTVEELDDLYDAVLWFYRAEEWKHLPWENAAVAYHDVTDDQCGFTVILQAARRREELEILRYRYAA